MFALYFITNAFSSTYHTFSFDKRVDWVDRKTSPKIIICEGSQVSKVTILKSIQFWNMYFEEYSNTDIEERSCDSTIDFIDGSIFITKEISFNTEDYYAMTHYKFKGNDSMNGIEAVRIEINPSYAQNDKLIIHELGHAIGVLHTSYDETHVMHTHVVDNEGVRTN
jgi:predicted Zn-dependent protease